MGQGCRESQRSYLGRPVATPSSDGNPNCEVGLRRQESAEVIVPMRRHRERPNVEEGGNSNCSRDERRRQNSSDEDTTGGAKAVKLPGFSQRAESSPALGEEMSEAGSRDPAFLSILWRTAGCNKARPVVWSSCEYWAL